LLIGWRVLHARHHSRSRCRPLSVTRLRFGDIVGYTFIVALACFAVTLIAMGLISPHL
jgi:sterol desaturase/sphingolipid hydroxylase (fatty acid hydroxylase superfamily)